MASVAEHYERHLAPVYLWMSGGIDAALYRGESEIDGMLPGLPRGGTAVDLGAGFGMHAIPLARRGSSVLAIDTSSTLLAALRARAGRLPVRTVEDDLLSFQRHLPSRADLVLCMGDTLTHLASAQAVDDLFARVAESLGRAGMFIVAFRDYTSPLIGDARFIPVRGDDTCILTCFLEYEPESVLVHDILHERTEGGWHTRVSHYRKLRLSPDHMSGSLRSKGFIVRRENAPGGMVRLIAHGKG